MKRFLSAVGRMLKPSSVTAFHSHWSVSPSSPKLPSRYELLTQIYGVLRYRALTGGNFKLYTDSQTYSLFRISGLTNLYDDVEVIEDFSGINRRVFWAANKLFAYMLTPAPCISIDLDAVVLDVSFFKRPHAFVALHEEPLNWSGYTKDEDAFERSPSIHNLFGMDSFEERERVWKASPVNMGVCLFNDDEFKERYAAQAIKFCRTYHVSDSTQRLPDETRSDGWTYFSEMIFAEQRLLPMMATSLGKRYSVLSEFLAAENGDGDHVVPNKYAVHLWNSKRLYSRHELARRAFVEGMVNKLLSEFGGKAECFLRRVGLPHRVIRDANFPEFFRISEDGDWFLPGEQAVNNVRPTI